MENIVLFCEKTECCGCGACFNVCPQKAIAMVPDEYGFIYPQIEYEKCVGCGLCKKVCEFQKKADLPSENETKVACSTDDDMLVKSASGGVFSALAKAVLQIGGVVFGCSMEKQEGKLWPEHIMIEHIDDLYKLQGSKYVQSFIGNSYRNVKSELEKGRYVLFSGTPCQIAGLKGFLRNKIYERLLMVDIVCHGVPSAKFFQDYIKMLEKKLGASSVSKFEFRDKTKGWGLNAKVTYEKNAKCYSKLIPAAESSYYKLFLESKIYRENCYACPYAGKLRTGDITIGDYWGIEKVHPEYLIHKGGEIEEKKGVSCLIINTEKGKRLLAELNPDLLLLASSFEKAAEENMQLCEPSKKSADRQQILDLYMNKGYSEVEKWYRKSQGIKYYLKLIWGYLPQNLKKIVRKIIKK